MALCSGNQKGLHVVILWQARSAKASGRSVSGRRKGEVSEEINKMNDL
jgi:hypothetical protein